MPGKGGPHVDDSSEERSRRFDRWITHTIFCLLVCLPAAVCGIFLVVVLLPKEPGDVTPEKVDTLPGQHFPMVSGPEIKIPSSADVDRPSAMASTPASPSHHLLPPVDPDEGACTSQLCRFAAQWLRSNMDLTRSPCQDFYRYVCGKFRGQNQLTQVSEETRQLNVLHLQNTYVPASNQNASQKAAGLYQTCMTFVQSNRNETADLVTWMQSLNLDLNDGKRLEKVNPTEMMVRCSLDLGVPAIVSFELLDTLFVQGKRGMKVKFSSEEDEWLKERSVLADDINKLYYASILRRYGVVAPRDTDLASSIAGYEIELGSIVEAQIHPYAPGIYVAIRYFGAYTKPYVSSDQWAGYFSKYTNNSYRSSDSLIVQQNVLSLIVELLKSKSVGQKGLQYLIAWSVYRQLMKYTLPHSLVGRRTKPDACYEHTEKAMHVAVTSPYYQTVVPPDKLEAVKTMLLNIRTAYADTFKNSSWVQGEDRIIAVQKLSKMRSYVGSPGQYLDPAYVEELYKTYRKRTFCLRRAHRLALRRRARRDEVDDFTDSENLADLVGVKTAYKAFSSLPNAQRTQTLKGLNASAERLFFISHCAKVCAEYSLQEGRHAPDRLRCIVPLMNMQAFSNAFGCTAGQFMNPNKKCDFWA
ncbi:hypothetical protein MTO96_026022 [Rhipicephalus appendiculatus]